MISYKTISANKKSFKKEWILYDADSQIVGRLASEIASKLKGKHRPFYTPNVICGDHIVVINAANVKFTGKKQTDKKYISHTGYPGGQKETTPEKIMAKHPTRVLEKAIRGMLPKTRLGRAMFNNVHIYHDDNHPHEAQQPKKITL